MARNNFIVSTPLVVPVTVAAKTILLVKSPANIGLAVKSFTIAFDSNNAGQQGMLVELIRVDTTSAGTSTGAATLTKKHTGTDTIQSTSGYNYSAEPTVATVLFRTVINPAGGVQYPFPLNEECIARNQESIAIRVTSNTGITPNAWASMECEE